MIRDQNARRRGVAYSTAMATLAAAALAPGCTSLHGLAHGVTHPITPEQSKAQVIDAARDVVHGLGLHYIDAYFWHGSCSDGGAGPFEGEIRISYPNAPSFAQSDSEVAAMVAHLQTLGWTTDPSFHTHATALTKSGVVAVFDPQNASTSTRGIELTGPCRDVTTTKSTAGAVEKLPPMD
jgi:hypothetical protein